MSYNIILYAKSPFFKLLVIYRIPITSRYWPMCIVAIVYTKSNGFFNTTHTNGTKHYMAVKKNTLGRNYLMW